MKIAFYCRVDGQGFGFILPEEADKSFKRVFRRGLDKVVLAR